MSFFFILHFLSITNKIFMSELYNRHSVKHTDSFLFGGRRGHRTQDGGRKGEESTLDVKDFHFPNTSAPLSVCITLAFLSRSLSLSLWPTIPPSSSLPPPIPLMLYLSFSLYTWLALLMAQGQELWELKRLDGRVSFSV